MARYTGPKTKISRKFGEPLFGEDRTLEKKNYPPGQHGQNKKGKPTDFGIKKSKALKKSKNKLTNKNLRRVSLFELQNSPKALLFRARA